MLTALKAKLALLIQTKVGAAVLAATLVAGGGSAVALAATHGHLSQIGSALSSATRGTHDTGKGNNADHSSAEGTLTAYTAPSGSTSGSISVKPEHGDSLTFQVTSDTRVNGFHSHDQQSGSHESNGTPTIEREGESTPDASDSGGNQPGTLSDLATNIGHKVQVQANKSGDNWVAWKVTIEGAQGDQSGQSGDNHGDNQGQQAVAGKIKSLNVTGLSFIVTTGKGDVTIEVNGNTHYAGVGHLTSLGDLKVGMAVAVQGSKQGDGSVLAQTVSVSGADSSGSAGGSGGHVPMPPVSAKAHPVGK